MLKPPWLESPSSISHSCLTKTCEFSGPSILKPIFLISGTVAQLRRRGGESADTKNNCLRSPKQLRMQSTLLSITSSQFGLVSYSLNRITISRYTEKAQRIRDLIKSKPLTSSQLLVKTTEWAIKNNGLDELKFESREQCTWSYYNLDVLLPILWIILSFIIPTIFGWNTFSCFGHIEAKINRKSKKA